MEKIVPNLWFDDNAEEAARFYTSLFDSSRILEITRYGESGAEVSGRPTGSVLTVSFELAGQSFIALNGGPVFRFSPAISFFVSCGHLKEFDRLWEKLSEGGKVLMEVGTYPFSERYGWLEDRYGLSWQLILSDRKQKITPSLLFIGTQYGKAEEAMKRYVSLMEGSEISVMERYQAGEEAPEGAVKFAVFRLGGQEFIAMESHLDHRFSFTHAVSLMVRCGNQDEIDRIWKTLSDGGEIEECGWLKDRYGVSWQVVPAVLDEMVRGDDPKRTERVMKAMFGMKKLDIAGLQEAYRKPD